MPTVLLFGCQPPTDRTADLLRGRYVRGSVPRSRAAHLQSRRYGTGLRKPLNSAYARGHAKHCSNTVAETL